MRAQDLRLVAAIAAVGSAILYYLIGFGVLNVGESTSGATTDLLGFGLVVGTAFLGVAAVVWLFRNRWLLGAIGLIDAAVVAGYFAMSSLREPPFEVWGLTIKVLQVVTFVSIAVLVFARLEDEPDAEAQPTLAPKGGAS